MNNTPAIVIIAYNRPKSLSRLLKSVSKAHYSNNNIPLVISVDYSADNKNILDIANNFEWKFGTKKIISHTKNLGLRNHVIKCGDLTEEFGAIIMLEDDLFVSSNYYLYAIQGLAFIENNKSIGGISLYNHQVNVHTNEVFTSIEDGYSNYYFQFASSWGQAWTLSQWNSFKEWYTIQNELKPSKRIPENVTNWSNKSWLKYFTAYLIINNKYFLYPKIGYTTNFSDEGTHVGMESSAYQVPLDFSKKLIVNFSDINDSLSVYDAFYENIALYKYLEINKTDLCINLYGHKKLTTERFLLSPEILDYKIIKSFGRNLRPIEMNIIENIDGRDLFLYDTSISIVNKNKINRIKRITYTIKIVAFKDALLIVNSQLLSKIKQLIGI